MMSRKSQPDGIKELALSLSQAQTLRSVADTVERFCGKTFGSPTGMIFVEREGNLELIRAWRSRQVSIKHLSAEIVKKGPIAQAFRTGDPVFWLRKHSRPSSVFRHLREALHLAHDGCAAFLPIGTARQSPVGVLAMAIPDTHGSASPMHDDLLRVGQILSGCIVRALAYEEALAARVIAERIIRQKDEFFSIISHELKNPMMPILGWAVALSSGTLPPEKQNLALDGIVRNVRALNCLIEDLFDAARVSTGKLRLQLSEIRIQDVAHEVLTAIEPGAEAKKLRVSTDISGAIPPFIADPRRLRQALTNLLNNSVKFTPEGGTISLRVSKRGDAVECTVSDTGKGIEQKFLPVVFDKFSQESRSPTDRSAGLGLGLSIAREIVHLHGGSIKAHSEGTDKGSTFILRLPMQKKRGRTAFVFDDPRRKISNHPK
jgi:signal transduction histidine kinase